MNELLTIASNSAWGRQSNVVGFGLRQDGAAADEVMLQVYVESCASCEFDQALIPERLTISDGRFATIEVQAIGRLRCHGAMDSNEPPAPAEAPFAPGSGVAHFRGAHGTAGCLVRKRGDDENLFLLSSAHVLRNQGLGRQGDAILRADSRQPIAALAEWSPYCFSVAGFQNSIDAATARLTLDARQEVVRHSPCLPRGVNYHLSVGMKVQKTGFGSGHTWGVVRDVHFCVQTHARRANGSWARLGLRNQILCTKFSGPGDSGAAVLDEAGNLVGLHFAGTASVSIFNPIGSVLAALQLEPLLQPE